MKLKRTLILFTLVLGILAGGTYAMYGQGNWENQDQCMMWNQNKQLMWGSWNCMWMWFDKTLNASQREKLQSMSMEDRMSYMHKLMWGSWNCMWMWREQNCQIRNNQMLQNMNTNIQKYADQTKVQKYEKIIKDKYSEKINSLSEEKIKKAINKIDNFVGQINNWNYTETKKGIYLNVLQALKEVLLEKIWVNNASSIIDFVFSN